MLRNQNKTNRSTETKQPMKSEIETKAGFSFIRYAQCWEDADIVLTAMNVKDGDKCLSIGSAGDNTLALLACDPSAVVALDLSPSQTALLELKTAAFKVLNHNEMMILLGYRKGFSRRELFNKVAPCLSKSSLEFWQSHATNIEYGIASCGKFERYFSVFRTAILPLIHSKKTVDELLIHRNHEGRSAFFSKRWDTMRWRLLFKLFFSKPVMGWLGRDPSFFTYASGNLPEILLNLTRQALVDQDPSNNPYLRWILKGEFGDALPYFLREENFEKIKRNLDRLQWYQLSLEEYLSSSPDDYFDSFNLSDVFEYASRDSYEALLHMLAQAARPQARLVYWNMMVPRQSVDVNANQVMPLNELSEYLFLKNKTFFYCRFLVEEILKSSPRAQ